MAAAVQDVPHIHIAMLNTDTPVPAVRNGPQSDSSQTYGDIFHRVLLAANTNAASSSSSFVSISHKNFDVVNFPYQYPTPEELETFDLIIVSGSAASAYDQEPWILTLEQWIRDVYNNNHRSGGPKLFGSCFGHQIICRALLENNVEKTGGRSVAVVEKDPKGYEIGVGDIELSDEFLSAMGGLTEEKEEKERLPPTPPAEEEKEAEQPFSLTNNVVGGGGGATNNSSNEKPKKSLRLQLVHADHVRVLSSSSSSSSSSPESPEFQPQPLLQLPPNWCVVGRTKHCANQGMLEYGKVLTYQGHFEFDRFINRETVKVFGTQWDEGLLKERLAMIERDDDSGVFAGFVLKFAMMQEGKWQGKNGEMMVGVQQGGMKMETEMEEDSGLITPP